MKTILASYYDNILNHETKGQFSKYFFHDQNKMPYIFIQVNDGIAKNSTLMVKGHLNKVMEFKCNTCIIMGYLHSLFTIIIFIEILDSLPIYHEIHVFKIIYSLYNMI
jgi:hypothetical protein